ncbi:helix-turn-helix domain-containing protein [Amycolatopsis alba]|uniref:XRE family transcriptional regulator n=1 Tax=Amycolatopsis alba DSM 44262 TaxID=1125972 RepID=A0A229S6M7_AMYAL|nr:helix-turn-helix transcriptional regulator [Amycolatopsis alba]OXM54558.1 XRE family transcriptional regulator [Amycolatopsis alba DSM 44262]
MTANSKRGDATPLCELLTEQRIAKGWSQCDLVAKLHTLSGNDSVTREEISRWERGKRIPGPYWRQWLGDVLDTSSQELELAAAVARRRRRKDEPVRRWTILD